MHAPASFPGRGASRSGTRTRSATRGKILEATRGFALSLQKHERRQETVYLRSGRILHHLNGGGLRDEPPTIRRGDLHRVEALEDAVILEVGTPERDDVARLDGRYGRTGT